MPRNRLVLLDAKDAVLGFVDVRHRCGHRPRYVVAPADGEPETDVARLR